MGYDTRNIRNIVLLGHPGSGKTSLTESMLYEAGVITRRGSTKAGSTVSDYTSFEQERGNTIFSTLMHAFWKDSKINLIDTPGFDDFAGEVISALKVADTAVMTLNATQGVEVGTELMWEYIEAFGTPALFVINQLDEDKADYQATLDQARERFGSKVLAVQFPAQSGQGFRAIIDGLRMLMYVFPPDGGKPEKEDIPAEHLEQARAIHNALVEAAAENDDTLMERYFEVGTLSEEELAEGLRIAIAHQQIFPVFCASAERNMGSGRVMGFINDICPSPADRPAARLEGGGELVCSVDDATTAFVYKTISEPQVGNVTYFKVYSGILKAGQELVNAQTGQMERFGQLFLANGKERTPTSEVRAGDIGVTVKLKNTHTNQTLNQDGTDRRIEPMHFPESRIRVAIKPPGKVEMEKLMRTIHLLEEEDPTLQVEQSPALKQTLLHGQGQLHIDLVKRRVEELCGIQMEFMRPRIAYRETITQTANAEYRHKKQSGGAGQFAEVHLRIEPYYEGMPEPADLTVRKHEIEALPWGGKLAFYWCIVGGSIDAKYSSAIKKGIMQYMEEGPLTGSPCQDIRVCIYDGKMHSVDSNDMAFMIAAKMAFRKAFQTAAPQLLEPIYDLEVLCASDVLGDVMSDLQTRRAMIMGMDAEGHYQKIIAKVPQAEMYLYASTLRSLTQGRAKFSRRFAEFTPTPQEVQREIVKQQEEGALA
ncbi:MAG: elongation factor G [Bacteroidetes bacterium]|nr:MAG: elongation factor G [Bacteroidota bacterium]